jgi:conjugal transfer pilus assembly protein TraF
MGKVNAAISLILAIGLSPALTHAGIDYDSVWRCDQAKFNWYCDIEENKAERQSEPKKQQSKTETALEKLERLQKALKETRAKAILDPTPDNVAAYIRMQNEVGELASTFSDTWRRVIWQNPDLNYELKRPVNNAGIDTYNKERWKAQMQTLEAIKKDWGIFFIFRGDCPYCHRMAPALKTLSEMYGISVFPVSADGGTLPEYPNPARDNGIVERLGITHVPMLVLANVKDKRLVPLGSGVVSIQDIIERIYILTSTKPGELY